MRSPYRTVDFWLLVATAVWLAGQLVLATSGLRIVTFDDQAVLRAIADPAQAGEARALDFRIGRFYAAVKFSTLEVLMLVSSDTWHATLRVLALALAAGAAAWFTWEWRRNWRTTLLLFVATLGLMQVTISYQAFLSYPHFFLGWVGVWAMAAFALRPDSTSNRAGILLAYATALIVHESNAVFVILPVVLRAAVRHENIFWTALRPFWACALVLAAYAGLALSLRHAASDIPASYQGTIMSFDLGRYALALNVFSLSSFPGIEGWRIRWSDAGQPLWLTPAEWLARIHARTTAIHLIGAALIGAAVWRGLARDDTELRASWRRTLPMLALVVAMAYAPNLLLAATIKYQGWAQQRMWPYYFSTMSYLAWMVFLVNGSEGLLSSLRRPGWRATGRAIVAGLTVVIALSVFASSAEALGYLRQQPLAHIKDYPHRQLK